MARDGRNSFQPFTFVQDSPETLAALLAARYFFVDSLLGPYASAPTVVTVPLKRPGLVVTTASVIDCLGPANVTFEGNYDVFGKDPFIGAFTEVGFAFKRREGEGNQELRVLLRRAGGVDGTGFRVVLARVIGVSEIDYYEYWYQSVEVYGEIGAITGISQAGLAEGWIGTMLRAGLVEMEALSPAVTPGCVLEIAAETSVPLFELEPVDVPTAANYVDSQFPRTQWQS